jgi:6-phosphogluconolactonase/glucosamine-6-phosphate isomerase/deaminase
MMLASGDGKARVVAQALEGAPVEAVPAALARDRDWYLDRAAAHQLSADAS